MKQSAALLLILSGLVLAVPQSYEWLTDFSGQPYIQVLLGVVSILVGVVYLFKK